MKGFKPPPQGAVFRMGIIGTQKFPLGIMYRMKSIQDAAAFLFIIAVGVLTAVCVLGVWDMFDKDVIWKSFQTVGLLAVVAVVVIIASRFMSLGIQQSTVPSLPNPIFRAIRQATLTVLIAVAALLALFGVLTIWEVITDTDVLYRSIGSLAVLAFGAFVIVVTAMDRENNPLLKQQGVSLGGTVVALILLYLIFAFGGLFS